MQEINNGRPLLGRRDRLHVDRFVGRRRVIHDRAVNEAAVGGGRRGGLLGSLLLQGLAAALDKDMALDVLD